ncbi:MAG: beta-lactamase family protein [Methylococcales bacterium]|nr:beta-lactamase family protein [Methylococcales bacterium]
MNSNKNTRHPKSDIFKKIIKDWQYFSPCLGANITIYDSDYGYSNYGTGFTSINPEQPLEKKSLFYIYSITKTLTAIVVMRLVENGLISLNDPIAKYLVDINLPKEVTIKNLLNHTSGVPSYTDIPNYMEANRESPSEPWSFDYVIKNTCNGKLDFNPGDKWYYSNTGYMLLLLMIESVSNKSLAQNIDEFIVKKIGLKSTYLAENIDVGKVTNGYCRYLNDKEEMKNITDIYNPWWCKTGLVVSTSDEITKLYYSLLSGRLVNKNSLHAMTKAVSIGQTAGSHFKNPSYGFGLMIDPENEYGISYGHGGDGPGFNTWSVYYPEFNNRSVGVTIFCNTSMGGHPLFLVNEILRALKGDNKWS